MKNKDKLFIFGNVFEDNGVAWYRQVQPLKWLGSNKHAHTRITEFTGEMKARQYTPDEVEELVKWANMIYLTSARNQQQAAMACLMRDWGKNYLIVDIDDNILNLNQDHPNFKHFNNVETSPAEWVLITIKYADLVITTNEYLKDIFKSWNKNIFVLPNCIDFKLWDYRKAVKARAKNKKVRIGWAGASGHYNDLGLLTKAVKELKKRNDVEFFLIGDHQNKRYFDYDKTLDWVPLDQYPDEYAKAGIDILVAPMRDSKYNRGKSCLRLLEAGSLKTPVVASPIGDYQGFPVLYAKDRDEWLKQLTRLVDDKKLRLKQGEVLYQKVKSEYDINVVMPSLLKELKKLSKKKWKPKKFWNNQ